jgi:hypothetical protein
LPTKFLTFTCFQFKDDDDDDDSDDEDVDDDSDDEDEDNADEDKAPNMAELLEELRKFSAQDM